MTIACSPKFSDREQGCTAQFPDWPRVLSLNCCFARQPSAVTFFRLAQAFHLRERVNSQRVNLYPSYMETYDMVCGMEISPWGSTLKSLMSSVSARQGNSFQSQYL